MRGERREWPTLLCSDNLSYHVDCSQSSSNSRSYAVDFLVGSLANSVGLPTPPAALIFVPKGWWLNTQPNVENLDADLEAREVVFGSQKIEATGAIDQVVGWLPDSFYKRVSNHQTILGAYALDKWCANTGSRQFLFTRSARTGSYSALLVGHSRCLGGAGWDCLAPSRAGRHVGGKCYDKVKSWDAFEPFLSDIVSTCPDTIWNLARDIPSQWYGSDPNILEALVDLLLRRRSLVREEISKARHQAPDLFPAWPRNLLTSRVVKARMSGSRDGSIHRFPLGPAAI